ncbi:MAG: DTW domain-containing protein [Bdellovibrionaceae bacterium]|nr:DTW domain-containing protein [Pseudobdellovibrionaceae bacterium]
MSLTRKRKTKDPCLTCGLHKNLCICSMIPRLSLKTRVCLIIHHRELKRTTNTGRLALHSLVNSELRVRGDKDRTPLDLSDLLTPHVRSVLFFPTDDADELNEAFVNKSQRPIQLIVPDGNWRQASKVTTRHPELQHLERVKLNITNTGSQHVRAEHFASGMATLQAIAHALGIIEGPQVQEQLLRLYKAKLNATLKGRGIIADNESE